MNNKSTEYEVYPKKASTDLITDIYGGNSIFLPFFLLKWGKMCTFAAVFLKGKRVNGHIV